ncbi:carbonic anhydrase, partial [Azoarcus sp. TTM-91]|uniref:surface-adhesin E family protein n=1 Tax=Azoarcus sp. TTM-91 TaxID=2691581 RepID=UPI00169FA7B3|nr:carbonic anhydrase [Azoarcus sp. TTM-91]
MKPLPLLAAALLLPLTLPAAADDWQLVLSDRDRRIEIDRGTIIDSDRGTKVAWGRIVLSLEESRTAGYTTIKALNRYDCMNRSFLTVKRVFMDSLDRVIREEAAADQEPVAIARNSVDERMWREVCRPPTVSELDKVAQQAARAAAPAAPAKAEVKPPPKRATVQQAPRRAETTPSGARALENAQVGRPAPVRSAQFQPNAQEAQPAAATEGSGEAATPMPRQPQPAGSRPAPAASNATPAPIPTPAKSPSPTPSPARPQAAAPAASSAPHATAQHRPAAATHAAAPASAHAAAAA